VQRDFVDIIVFVKEGGILRTVDNRYRHLIHEVDDRLVAEFNTAKLPEKFFTPPCSTLLKLSKVQ